MLVSLYDTLVTVASICLCVIAGYVFFFFQAEDGIRDLVRSRGLGDVYKRQHQKISATQQRKLPPASSISVKSILRTLKPA